MIGIFHYNKLFYKDILVHIFRIVSRLIVSNEYAIAYLQVQSGFPVPEGDFLGSLQYNALITTNPNAVIKIDPTTCTNTEVSAHR